MIGLTQNLGQLQINFSEIEQKIDTVKKSKRPEDDKHDRGLKGNLGATSHNSFEDPNTNGVKGNANDCTQHAPTW